NMGSLPIFNFSLLPVVLVTIPVAYILGLWLKLDVYKPDIRWTGGMFVGYMLVLSMVLHGDSEIRSLSDMGVDDLVTFFSHGFEAIKATIHYGLTTAIDAFDRLMILFVLWVALDGVKVFRDWRTYLGHGFFLLMLLAALAGSSLLNFAMDTIQMFNIVFVLVYYVLMALLFQRILERPKAYILKGVVVAISCFFLVRFALGMNFEGVRMERYNPAYLTEIQDNITSLQGEGVRFLSDSYYRNAYQLNPNCNFEGYALSYLRNTLVIHTLTIFEVQDKESYLNYFNSNRDRIMSSIYFVRYVRERAQTFSSSEIEQLQIQFMKEHQINFVVAPDKQLIPKSIQAMFQQSITDPASGEIILFEANYL
ncbi:MAG: hypothetical protein AAFR59_09960, partial [Bacteroidota bacterium]